MLIKQGNISGKGGLAVTDPVYGDKVKCRYVKKRLPANVPLLFTCIVDTKEEDYSEGITNPVLADKLKSCKIIDVSILIQTKLPPELNCSEPLITKNEGEDGFSFWKCLKLKKFEIGVDSARVFIGRASEIDEYYGVIRTGGDGLLGDVYELSLPAPIKVKSKSGNIVDIPSGWTGVVISLTFDGDLLSEKDVFKEIVAGFNVA